MVIPPSHLTCAHRRGSLLAEMTFGLSIVALVLIPLSLSFRTDALLARSLYHRAAAMEVVDGEIELLAAGEWRTYGPGTHDFRPRANVATNLPPGRFTLSVSNTVLTLNWSPTGHHAGGPVTREARIQP